jgi:hypothetical protein
MGPYEIIKVAVCSASCFGEAQISKEQFGYVPIKPLRWQYAQLLALERPKSVRSNLVVGPYEIIRCSANKELLALERPKSVRSNLVMGPY